MPPPQARSKALKPRGANKPKQYWLYVMKDFEGKVLYIGITSRSVERRWAEHARVHDWWDEVYYEDSEVHDLGVTTWDDAHATEIEMSNTYRPHYEGDADALPSVRRQGLMNRKLASKAREAATSSEGWDRSDWDDPVADDKVVAVIEWILLGGFLAWVAWAATHGDLWHPLWPW